MTNDEYLTVLGKLDERSVQLLNRAIIDPKAEYLGPTAMVSGMRIVQAFANAPHSELVRIAHRYAIERGNAKSNEEEKYQMIASLQRLGELIPESLWRYSWVEMGVLLNNANLIAGKSQITPLIILYTLIDIAPEFFERAFEEVNIDFETFRQSVSVINTFELHEAANEALKEAGIVLGNEDLKFKFDLEIPSPREFNLWIDPGNASVDDIKELFSALSDLNRAHGGPGLTFVPDEKQEPIIVCHA